MASSLNIVEQPAFGDFNAGEIFGLALQAAGGFTSAIGQYAQVRAAKSSANIQADDLEFQATTADRNARAAEADAIEILRVGRHRLAVRGLEGEREVQGNRARTAARGVEVGSGSSAEVEASLRVAQRIDEMEIDTAARRSAANARREATARRTRGIFARSSADVARINARGLSPAFAVGSSLLGSAARFGISFSQAGR